MSDLLAARAQMGTSIAFHITFAFLGVGGLCGDWLRCFGYLSLTDTAWQARILLPNRFPGNRPLFSCYPFVGCYS